MSPASLAVALNDRDKAWHDIYRIDIRTGERELLFENRSELAGIVLDRQLMPRLAIKPRDAGGRQHRLSHRRRRAGADARGRARGRSHHAPHWLHARRQHALQHLLGRPRQGGAIRHGLGERARTSVLAEHPKADISRVIVASRVRGVVEAVGAKHLTLDWIPLDERMAADLKRLHGALPGEVDDRRPHAR